MGFEKRTSVERVKKTETVEQKRKHLFRRLFKVAPILLVLGGGYSFLPDNSTSDRVVDKSDSDKDRSNELKALMARFQELINGLSDNAVVALTEEVESAETPDPIWEAVQNKREAIANDSEEGEARLSEYAETEKFHIALKEHLKKFTFISVEENNDGASKDDMVVGGRDAIGIKSSLDFALARGVIVSRSDGTIILNLMKQGFGVKEFNSMVELDAYIAKVATLNDAIEEARKSLPLNTDESYEAEQQRLVAPAEQALKNFLEEL